MTTSPSDLRTPDATESGLTARGRQTGEGKTNPLKTASAPKKDGTRDRSGEVDLQLGKKSKKRKKRKKPPTVPELRRAFTVPEFCRDHGICVATFYNLKKVNKAPRTMRVLNRTLISVEAARDWRRQREIEEVT
jgi:hypothetical protein